jgi:hypothetical protein
MPLRSAKPHPVPLVTALLTGPPELAVPFIEQLGDNWCWAASAQMVLTFYQRPKQQCELANTLFGFRNCCATRPPLTQPVNGIPACDRRCPGDQVVPLYNQFGLAANRLHAVATHAVLEQEITQQRPVEVGLQIPTSSGHLVIVRWAGTDDAGQQLVLVNNPLHAESSSMTYQDLQTRGAVDSWTGIQVI